MLGGARDAPKAPGALQPPAALGRGALPVPVRGVGGKGRSRAKTPGKTGGGTRGGAGPPSAAPPPVPRRFFLPPPPPAPPALATAPRRKWPRGRAAADALRAAPAPQPRYVRDGPGGTGRGALAAGLCAELGHAAGAAGALRAMPPCPWPWHQPWDCCPRGAPACGGRRPWGDWPWGVRAVAVLLLTGASSCGCVTRGGLLATESTSRGDAAHGRLPAVGFCLRG